MDILSSLFAGGIKGVAEGVGSLAKNIREAIVGPELSADQKARIELQLMAMESALQQAAQQYDIEQMRGQVDLNKIESAQDSWFKSAWRPATGWCCVLGLFYTFIIRPVLPWAVDTGCKIFGGASALAVMPEIPMGDLMVLLGGMLGLGVMRSTEKIMGRKS